MRGDSETWPRAGRTVLRGLSSGRSSRYQKQLTPTYATGNTSTVHTVQMSPRHDAVFCPIFRSHTISPNHLFPVVGSGGRAVERRTVNRGDGGLINPTYRRFETWAISFTPHLPVSFGRDTKSQWSLLSGVIVRGSKHPHMG